MRVAATAVLAAALLTGPALPAACAPAQAAAPFPAVPLESPPRRGHLWAYLSLATGAGLVAYSFQLADEGNDAYAAYLVSTDPSEIERLYDRTVRYDRLSQAALFTGEALIAAGLYLRFIRRPAGEAVRVSFAPARCTVSLRF